MKKRGIRMKINNVVSSGPIVIHPVPITYGENVHLHYKGFLTTDNQAEVYAHIGYGPNNRWEHIQDFKMQKSGNEYVAVVPVQYDGRLNICFKSQNGQWDNNYGSNWSFEVHNGDPNVIR